ncbi:MULTISPECIES: ABC transporter permease [Bacillaceae]|uniref:Putative hemin transport system permease protein HrtB n=1 Tax=Evansella alkalicola TaxID=745819 RepID=A0ABS6JXW4_9BACI|nr:MULTISPECIES: ABC transporter permease [Bacillaceae]MBU9723444.1 ABC transporter permease [Bacillus alkalicola]
MFLAWKEFSRNKLRYTLLSLIMIAVLFLVFFITALSNGLGYADSAAISNLNAEYVILSEEAEGVMIKSELNNKNLDEVFELLGNEYSPFAITISALERKNERSVDIVYFTVNTSRYGDVEITEGKNLSELEENEVVVDESIKGFGFELNDTILDSRTDIEMVIAGFTKDHVYSHMPVIFTDESIGFQAVYRMEDTYNAVLYNGEMVELDQYEVQTLDETIKTIPGYSETQGSFTMMKVFLVVISVFVSSVFFYVITLQKTHQFGILKAIGANTWFITKSILIQVSFITLIGLIFSNLAFYGIVQVMPEEMPIILSWNLILGTGILFLCLNTIGALLSIRKVTKIDALEAMGRAE